jgi:nucleotide-binding universal stress UspA family protein
MRINRILCPTDLSDASTHAADQAAVIARWYGARLTALHVVSPVVPPLEAASLDDVHRNVALCFESATRAGTPVDVVVEVGAPAPQILNRAAILPADLIVMGTHGSGGFEHLLLGSVTEKVLRKATCPVLTVPPRAAATSQLPFRNLLCAVDFSESSLAALPYALSLAGESRAALTLVHVLEWPWPEPPAPRLEELPAAQAAALAEYRSGRERTATARLESLLPPPERATSPATIRLANGKPYTEVLKVAAEEHADLIVMGIGARNPLDLTVFGSTTNQMVRRATCPVLTVRR